MRAWRRPVKSDEGALLLVDKPAGLTSHDVVQRIRAALGTRRIGHTGTLDPFATGLLLLCVGPLTRFAEYFHLLSKTYHATMRLGSETTTDDGTGEVTAQSEDWRSITEEGLIRALANRVGPAEQVPPIFSAKRVEGVRAHERARVGQTPSMKPAAIVVHSLALRDFTPPDIAFSTRVSTGTYIRALARDLGRDLGCGAHLTELRRTTIGPFRVEDAASPGSIEGEAVPARARRSPREAVDWLPTRELTEAEEEDVRHGRRIPGSDITPGDLDEIGEASASVVLVRGGRLLGVAESSGAELQPRKVLVAK
jgi:tRNA pseudouridine55 synthase